MEPKIHSITNTITINDCVPTAKLKKNNDNDKIFSQERRFAMSARSGYAFFIENFIKFG